MTFDASQSNNDPMLDNPSRERCLRYLLGELETAELVAFEKELSHSSDVSDELLRQADLLCHVSASRSGQAVEPVLVSHGTPHVRLLMAIAALAACLVIMVGSFRALNRDQSVARVDPGASISSGPEARVPADASVSEASLIAQAWATSRTDAVVEDDLATHEYEYEWVIKTEDVVSEDSAFSWMVHAIAADSDSPIEAATSDG